MKGKLLNKNGNWVIKHIHYTDADACPAVTCEFKLHPEDITQIKKDSLIFDDIESRIACYPDVEFELKDSYAKLIVENK